MRLKTSAPFASAPFRDEKGKTKKKGVQPSKTKGAVPKTKMCNIRVIKEIARNLQDNGRFEPEAIQALNEAVESYLENFVKECLKAFPRDVAVRKDLGNELGIRAGRITVFPRDVALHKKLAKMDTDYHPIVETEFDLSSALALLGIDDDLCGEGGQSSVDKTEFDLSSALALLEIDDDLCGEGGQRP